MYDKSHTVPGKNRGQHLFVLQIYINHILTYNGLRLFRTSPEFEAGLGHDQAARLLVKDTAIT